mgnify:CR=1 FL=1
MATRVAAIGQVLQLQIEGLGHDGQGVGRWRDVALFVPGALPGETVSVRVRRLAKRHLEADLIGVETPSPQRIRPALELAVEAAIDVGATYLKTGSGFGPAATVEQVQRLRQLARGRAAVKASGGIAGLEQAVALVEAGATRLGTSRGVALMQALRRGPDVTRSDEAGQSQQLSNQDLADR